VLTSEGRADRYAHCKQTDVLHGLRYYMIQQELLRDYPPEVAKNQNLKKELKGGKKNMQF
jgi:hypothetical protein